jgi:hypothetical protein
MVDNAARTPSSHPITFVSLSQNLSCSMGLSEYRIAICIAQRARPALHIHVDRFYESLLNPSIFNPKPLPGLLNAMYLMGCNLSNDLTLMALESFYLDQTRRLLAEELAQPDVPLIQWLQASCLVAFYLHRVGRFLEARNEVRHAGRCIIRQ